MHFWSNVQMDNCVFQKNLNYFQAIPAIRQSRGRSFHGMHEHGIHNTYIPADRPTTLLTHTEIRSRAILIFFLWKTKLLSEHFIFNQMLVKQNVFVKWKIKTNFFGCLFGSARRRWRRMVRDDIFASLGLQWCFFIRMLTMDDHKN